jgi:hypothetical protein
MTETLGASKGPCNRPTERRRTSNPQNNNTIKISFTTGVYHDLVRLGVRDRRRRFYAGELQ